MKKLLLFLGTTVIIFAVAAISLLSSSRQQEPLSHTAAHISFPEDSTASPSSENSQPTPSEPVDIPEQAVFDGAFPEEYYPYRAHLSHEQQKAYDLLYKAALQVQSKILLDGSLTKEEFRAVVHSLHFDHPELFWMTPDYTYNYDLMNKVTSVTLTYNQTIQDLPQAKADFEAALNQLVEEASQYSTPVQQEKYVHDYLVENCEYISDYPIDQSAYGVLINKKAVCSGYSRTFQLVMQRLGIPAYYCDGYSKQENLPLDSSWENQGKHSWNIILLDGEYYNVDVTWDDPVNNPDKIIYYDYFNISDQRIGFDHHRKEISQILPLCSNDQFDYSALGIGPENFNPKLHTALEMGFDPDQAVPDLKAYYALSEKLLLDAGTGVHTFTFLLSNQAIAEQIHYEVNQKEALEKITSSCIKQLGISSYSSHINVNTNVTRDGYVILQQTIELTEEDS